MSQLEDAIKPVLVPVMNGETRTIRGNHRALVARWATKTAIAFEQDDLETSRIGEAQIRDVRTGRPARWSGVWVARWGAPDEVVLRHDIVSAHHPTTMQLASQWARTCIGLGQGIALIIMNSVAPLADFSHVAPGEPWQQLWPNLAGDVQLRRGAVTRSDMESHLRRT
jgi:hypothetical protein